MPLSFDVESGAPVQEDDKRCRFGAGRFEQFSTEIAVALSIDEFAQPSAAPGDSNLLLGERRGGQQ